MLLRISRNHRFFVMTIFHLVWTIPIAKFPVKDLESLVNITYAASAIISGVLHCLSMPSPPIISIAAVMMAKTNLKNCVDLNIYYTKLKSSNEKHSFHYLFYLFLAKGRSQQYYLA